MRPCLALFLVFFTLSKAWAALTFSWERSTTTGHDRLELSDQSERWLIKKTSNWFDRYGDQRLGAFSVPESSALSQIKAELKQMSEELAIAQKRLAQSEQSFNALNTPDAPHAPYFRLNGFRVQQGSTLYPKMQAVAAKLQRLPARLEEGVELDRARKHYVFYQRGKEVSREPFNARFFCESAHFPTRCLARQWGAFYLE